MAGPFDVIGGLVSGAENKVGSFLQGMFPGSNASAPAQPRNAPLPSPQASPTQPAKTPLGGMAPPNVLGSLQKSASARPALDMLGQFSQDVGLTQLGKNFVSTDTNNPNTFAGQVANKNSPVSQLQTTVNNNPVSKAASYVGNILNAGVIDPIRLAADPQMWFAENSGNGTGSGNLGILSGDFSGKNVGHNYLRDILAPVIKNVTGENVPHTTSFYQTQAKQLASEGQRLQSIQDTLSPNSSQVQIDAFNAKLNEYDAKVQNYNTEYQKSQDWWANSNTSKMLSLLGQASTFPAGFAAGAATFFPQLVADPIGTGEGLIGQVQQAANFVGVLMNPDAREHMSAQELAANISNIAMLAGVMFGARKLPGGIKDTVLGRKPTPEAIDRVKSNLQSTSPDLNNPEPSPHVANPPVNPNAPRPEIQAHLDQRAEDVKNLQQRIINTTDPNHRAVLQKQLNDIQDETQGIKSRGLLNRIKNPNDFENQQPQSQDFPQYNNTEQNFQNVQKQAGYEAVSDVAAEKQLDQFPQYTKPVIPNTGFKEGPADTLLENLQDFTRPAVQQEAMRNNPQDYASPSARTETPQTNFEQMSPRGIQALAKELGFQVLSPDKITNNAWIDPRSGKAINFRASAFDLYQHADFVDAMRQPGDTRSTEQITEDMMRQGFVKVTEIAGMKAYAVDMLDPENIELIGQSIEGDIQRSYEKGEGRLYPYQVVESSSNRSYSITAQDLAANDFNLAKAISQQRRLMPRAQGEINEKGNVASLPSGAKGAPSTPSEGRNQTPTGAPKESTLTTVIPGPKDQGPVAIWSPDPKSSRAISSVKRGSVELSKALNQAIEGFTSDYNEVIDIENLEKHPVNFARREKEIISVFKTQIDGLDPYGFANIKHLIINPDLPSDAMYDPATGQVHVNPYKSVQINWMRNAVNHVETGLNKSKSLIPDEGKAAAYQWIQDMKNITQAQLDFRMLSEEVLHMYDRGMDNNTAYLNRLQRLPLAWWDHANRSGLGDMIEGGLTSWNENGGFVLKTIDGQRVPSWLDAFYAAQNNLLDLPSYMATMHTFMEYRVSQLLNYHGVPGVKFTYRVPEVMLRELENPALITEGAKLAGDDFERYVREETAPGLSLARVSQEKAQANAAGANAGISELAPTSTDATLSGSTAVGGNGSIPEYQGGVSPEARTVKGQDYPQVGDRIEIDLGTDERVGDTTVHKPNWVSFWNQPLRDQEDVQKASEAVLSKLVTGTNKLPASLRVVSKTGQVRKFDSAPPTNQSQGFAQQGTVDVREPTTTFHKIETPPMSQEKPQLEDSDISSVSGAPKGYPLRSPSKPSKFKNIPSSLGSKFNYRPLTELGKTGYPGTWEDFMASMASPEDSLAYKTAKPYWDKLDPRWQETFMEAMGTPGVEGAAVGGVGRQGPGAPEDVNSPAFRARQEKIQEFRSDVEKSGPVLDRLSRSVTTAEGLKKYNQLKALTAAKRKYAELSPGIPELEATQLMGQEYQKVLNDLESKGQTAPLPGEEKINPTTRDLVNKLQPVLRAYLNAKVSVQKSTGGLAPGYYSSLEKFIDGYAAKEDNAIKIYNTLPKTSKQAIRDLTTEIPQSFQIPGRARPDQTIIPSSQQTSQEHINPTSNEDLKTIVESAAKLFVRHGSTSLNEKGLVRAHSNPPLSSLGRLQARNIASAFRGRKNLRIISHDLERAMDTATTIAQAARGSKVTVDEDLRPWNVGSALTGMASVTANPRMLKMMTDAPDYVPEGGESFNQFKERFIGALRKYIYNSDVFTVSTRNMRLAEDWITQGMPEHDKFEAGSAMQTVREVGPGGIMALGNKPDGNYTVTHKASQMPSDTQNINVPKLKTTLPQRPEKVVVKTSSRPAVESPMQVDPTTQSKSQYNIKIGEQSNARAAAIRGEISPTMPQDVNDHIDAIVADPSIAATNPLKVAAVRAKLAKDAVSYAKGIDVPQEAIAEQVKEYNIQIGKVSDLIANQAKDREKVAPQEVKVPQNKLIHDLSLKKAELHFKRVTQGKNWHESAAQAAKELGIFDKKEPFADALAKIKDASMFLLPADHEVYSLAPAFKDVFTDPKALELIKNDKANEPQTQGLLPLTSEKLMGVDVPVNTSKPVGPSKVVVKKPKNPAPPAIAEHLAARTPSVTPPVEVPAQELPKNYKINIGSHDKLSTTDLRAQTKEIAEAMNTEVPSLMEQDPEEQLAAEERDVVDQASKGKGPIPEVKTSGGGGNNGKPPSDPFRGWDDARDFAGSFGGNLKDLSRRFDYALKAMGKIHDPASKLAHPKMMARSFNQADVEAQFVGEDIETLLNKLLPATIDKKGNWTNPEELAHHQAIAKAAGGQNEESRHQALMSLSAQDQALVGLLHTYHDVMGRLGVRPEAQVFEAAQDNYFARRVIQDETGQAPMNKQGAVKFSTNMGIKRARRKREVLVGEDANGNAIIKTENYYKDNEDLKAAGFKVEENVAKLWRYHWDAFSNMNLAHQLISYLSGPDMATFHETSIKPGKFDLTTRGRLDIPKGAEPYEGRPILPRVESRGGKMQATDIDPKARQQLTTVARGRWERVLANYHVYKPIAEELERQAPATGDNFAEKTAVALSNANGIYKVFKFAFNTLHLGNLLSNVYALGTKGLLDRATYDPKALHSRIFGRTNSLLSDETTYKDWNGQDIQGKDMVSKLMSWGAVMPKQIIDTASLGGLTGTLSRNVPGFQQWHNVMWHEVAWKAHIGLSLHLLDVMRTEIAKPENLGRELNEAEFENAGRMAVAQAKHAMGFLTKDEMTRDWQIYGNSLFLANSWSLAQARFMGQAAGKLPGAKYLANLGGGETYNDRVTNQMREMGGMSQKSLDAINGYQGKFARRLMLGGSAKLLAMSTIMTYIGSQLLTGQSQGPYQNFQRDPTHTFDIYMGVDPVTQKNRWLHNPLFGMQQEVALYGLQAVKDWGQGGNPYDMFTSVAGRVMNKANPILSTSLDLLINRNLSLYMQGYGDRSDISADPNLIAIRRALDASGMNPFPGAGWENNLLYAVRQLFPSPGFPDILNTQQGTAPAQTNATLGNTLNALGPGKVAGIGDLINAVQSGDFSGLAKKDLGDLAMWLTGTRIATSSTPEQLATNNQIGSSVASRDQRDQALADMSRAAQTGDWKTVAQIQSELGLTSSQLLSALEHPPAGFNGGPGIIYGNHPSAQQSTPLPQDSINGVTLTNAQTSELESMKSVAVENMIREVTGLPEFKSADNTNATAMLAAYSSLVNGMVTDQYSQQIGLLGGTPITNADIQGALNTAVEFRGISEQVLSNMDLYTQATPMERQRMETSFNSYAITLAKDAFNGNLRGVPIENVRQMLAYTIQVEQSTRMALENSMFFQLASPNDQSRMYSEYSALSREVAKREALQQGQGSYAFRIPPDKMIPTIEFIINTEETGKAMLHGTDYYAAADPNEQKSLDTKYETLARGLAFSTSNADPRTLIQNSIQSDQAYFDLQNQFGGNSYIKLMAQQLSDLERNIRTSSTYSPRQISALERTIRTQFLTQNPAYSAWLKAKTDWGKYTSEGQIYNALNNSEYAAVSDMQAAGVVQSNSLLLAGGSTDFSMMDPSTQLGLPSVDYNTFNTENP